MTAVCHSERSEESQRDTSQIRHRNYEPKHLAIVGREEKISYLDSGETKSLTIRFDKAEELVFYCSQPGHRGKGMEGKITVK